MLLVEDHGVSLKDDGEGGVASGTLDGEAAIVCEVIVCAVRVSEKHWRAGEAEERSGQDVHDVAVKMDVNWSCREMTMNFRLDLLMRGKRQGDPLILNALVSDAVAVWIHWVGRNRMVNSALN